MHIAVKALGIKHIIVCGAIKGLLHPEKMSSMPTVTHWLSHAEATRWIIKENYPDLPENQQINVAIQENILVQLENIKTLPSVASRLIMGDLNLHGWVYKFETGEVFSYSSEQGQFIKLVESNTEQVTQIRPVILPSI